MTKPKAYFITLEGGEGVGKTTNLRFIEQQLTSAGIPYITTREPGGTPLAENLRQLLLSDSTDPPTGLTELLLMFAGRAQHLAKVIRPALEQGTWVICDRFTDASYAYQVSGRGQSAAELELLEELVQQGLQPDLTLLLDMPVAAAAVRVDTRGQQRDRFEQEQQEFFERVRQGYLTRARQFPERFRLVNAALSLPEVQAQVAKYLQPFLPSR